MAPRRHEGGLAGELLEASPGDIELVDGTARVRGVPGRQLTLGALATVANPIRYAYGKEAAEAALKLVKPRQGAVLRDDEEPGLEARGYYAPPQATFASGCHAAIVAVDVETLEERPLPEQVIAALAPHTVSAPDGATAAQSGGGSSASSRY